MNQTEREDYEALCAWRDGGFKGPPPPKPGSSTERIPDGTIHVRDVDSSCEFFEPGEPRIGSTCEGDGHYLCHECAERAPREGEDSTCETCFDLWCCKESKEGHVCEDYRPPLPREGEEGTDGR